jgi:hypothetical protein
MNSAPASTATTIVDLPFGHSVAVTRTDSGAVLRICAPGAAPDIELEIAVTSAGATLRKRTLSARPPASIPSPASFIPTSSHVVPSSVAPPPASAIPVSSNVVPSATSLAPPPLLGASQPRLSVQQYAALRAECLVAAPAGVAEARARFGLDEAGDTAEVEAWGRKFKQDPGLFESYKRLFQVFRNKAPASPSTLASGVPAPMRTPRSEVMSTAALHRILPLGEHATMAAELLVMPEDQVYAKHDLADPAVRSEVLRVCEQRLQDPATLKTLEKLHAIAVAKHRRA